MLNRRDAMLRLGQVGAGLTLPSLLQSQNASASQPGDAARKREGEVVHPALPVGWPAAAGHVGHEA